jgi:hypothetical protein
MSKKEKEIEKLAQVLTSWEKGLARLGECMIEFQRIEETLSICISAMIGRSRRVGEIVTCEMSFRAKVSTFSALFLHLLKVQSLPDDIINLIQRLYWAEQQRNILAHSLWDASEKQPETIRREKRAIRKRQFVVSEEHLTPDELADLSRMFEGVSTDLFYLTKEYLPGLQRRLR